MDKNLKNLMKWHIAAVKMILSIDEPILPAEKVNRLINYSQELNLQWSDNLLKFYLKATMGTCQIIKTLVSDPNFKFLPLDERHMWLKHKEDYEQKFLKKLH